MLINNIFLALIDIAAFWLISKVYYSNPKKKINQLFCLVTLFLLFWWNGGYFFSFSNNLEFSLILGKIILGEVSISFTLIYFFTIFFPYETKRNKSWEKFVIFLSSISLLLSTFTNLVVRDVKFTPWGINPIFGPGQIFYYGWIGFLIILILISIIRKYLKSSKTERRKIHYFLIGFSIFLLMNLIFNIFLPIWQESIKYWQFGNYAAIFFLGFTAYAIIKQQLFGIKIILTEFFTGLIIILLFIDVLSSKTSFEYIWKSILLGIYLIFGHLLVNSTLKEIKQKDKLEIAHRQLEFAYQKLKKVDQAKGEFLSIATHQ